MRAGSPTHALPGLSSGQRPFPPLPRPRTSSPLVGCLVPWLRTPHPQYPFTAACPNPCGRAGSTVSVPRSDPVCEGPTQVPAGPACPPGQEVLGVRTHRDQSACLSSREEKPLSRVHPRPQEAGGGGGVFKGTGLGFGQIGLLDHGEPRLERLRGGPADGQGADESDTRGRVCSSDPSAQRQGGLVLRPTPPPSGEHQAVEDLPLGSPEDELGEKEPGGTGRVVAGRGGKAALLETATGRSSRRCGRGLVDRVRLGWT